MQPILFHIGTFAVYSYGFCMAVAFIVGSLLLIRDSETFGIAREKAVDIFFWVLIGGLLGARFLYVALNWTMFVNDPLRIFAFRDGGMAFQGGLVLALMFCYISCRIKKIPFLRMCDLIAPYVALGQAIGRVGCLLNGCCYGKPTTSFFYVVFPGEEVQRIPVQVYSAIGLAVLFLVLLHIRKQRFSAGVVLASYFMLYSILRFTLDFFRGDTPAVWMFMNMSQIICIGIFSVSVLLFGFIYFFSRRR